MGKKVKKVKKIKKDKIKNAPQQPKVSAAEELEKKLGVADAAILVTATHGNIEVVGLKNTNYAYQAKGLLHGALDSYIVIPINRTLNNMNRNNIGSIQNAVNQIKKWLGVKDEPVPPHTREEITLKPAKE